MNQLTPSGKNKAGDKPARRKPRLAPADVESSQTINGENGVGKIDARGDAQVKITQKTIFTQLSEDEETRRKQESELKELQNAVRQKYTEMKLLFNAPLPASGNPYLSMQAFKFADRTRFFGREDIIQDLLEQLKASHTTFLNGTGKTSALQAGVMPALFKEGHLPLMISASTHLLSTSIKEQLLPNIEAMDFLKTMSLPEFIRRVTGYLNKGAQLFLLVDEFEFLFSKSTKPSQEEIYDTFKAEWELCVSDIAPDAHWLFSVPTRFTYLLNIFKGEVAINPNLITLHPFERTEARQALLGQAALRDMQIDATVADAILDQLDMDNKSRIDPTQLELVCYMLAGGKGVLIKHWTMEYYSSQGKADGILRGYLDSTINELEPIKQEPAWQLLATLIEPSHSVTSETELIQKMKRLDISEEITHQVLVFLQNSHLVEYATAYKLSSDSLRPGIEAWRDKRAAMVQAKEEVWRQVRNIGGSALRGLIGGAIGFSLAYWALPYGGKVSITDLSLFFDAYFYTIILRMLVGAVAGFVRSLAIDLILAHFKGIRDRLTIPDGMLTAAISFAIALAFHFTLHYMAHQKLFLVGVAAVEGSVWGVAAGAGAVWVMISTQQTWLKLLAVSAACGLILTLSDLFLNGLDVSAPFYNVFITGMVMPLFLIGSALLGKPPLMKE